MKLSSDTFEEIHEYFDYNAPMESFTAVAAQHIVKNIREHGYTVEGQPDRQAMALAEEVGEFMGAWRRWRGQARRTDTLEHVQEELADVVIVAYVLAQERAWDLDELIEVKLREIFTRGWKEGVNVSEDV